MPIYEYECNENKHRFEKWQSIQDEPIKTCPTCNSPVHKVLHPAGIIFKGSGWYITDNRKSSSSSSPTASSDSNSSATETKSDNKAKSETKSEKVESKGEKPAGDGSSNKPE